MKVSNLTEAAKELEGYSGADIEQIINRVGLQCVRQARLKKKMGEV